MQYRVPKELSTWWQRAGRAGRNLGIKATAILLAEPCFFDDEKERLAAKSAERAKQKRAAEVQLQPETVKRSRNNKGSRRNVHASTTSTTNASDRPKINPEMDDFINAEHRPCNCRRAVTSSHFGNVGLRKFTSYLRLSRTMPHAFLPSVPVIEKFCCERCRVHFPEVCCDICHPDHYKMPVVEPSTKATRLKNKLNPKPYTRGPPEMSLRAALIDMRCELAAEIFGPHSFLTPQCIMSTKLLDRVVDLAHYQKITNITSLHEQVTWGYLDTHGTIILRLINQFYPPPTNPSPLNPLSLNSSPFTTAPLQSHAQPTASSSSDRLSFDVAVPKKRNCKNCGIPGHYSM